MGISDAVMEHGNGDDGEQKTKTKHKGKHDKPKPWDDPSIDHWKIDKFDPSWNEAGMLDVSSFSTLFPQYGGLSTSFIVHRGVRIMVFPYSFMAVEEFARVYSFSSLIWVTIPCYRHDSGIFMLKFMTFWGGFLTSRRDCGIFMLKLMENWDGFFDVQL